MPLEEYRRKRSAGVTPEPGVEPDAPAAGAAAGAAARLRFVVQEHHARALHWDFRLELDGVLLSWAVPKGPSLDPKVKHLAVHVEDHPTEYGCFEGEIPAGEYGAGTVYLWDSGTWEPLGDPHEGLTKGDFKFVLNGQRLHGLWVLVRMKPRPGDKRENWLLIKERDEFARPESEYVITAEERGSLPGAAPECTAAPATAAAAARSAEAAAPLAPRDIPGAEAGELPPFLAPALATPVPDAPLGDNWAHEPKLDGYRLLARIEGGRATLRTRRDQDWTARFPELAAQLASLPVASGMLDGEVVALGSDGLTDFGALQTALSKKRTAGLIYYAFDLLFLDGYDLRRSALTDRKAALERVLEAAADSMPAIRFVPHVLGRGRDFRDRACVLGLEGSVSKRADSAYLSGRSRAWLKAKCIHAQEFVVVGWLPGKGARAALGSLIVGFHDAEGRLRAAGRVGTGFSEGEIAQLTQRLAELETGDALAGLPDALDARGAHWVRPELVVQVRFAEWTRDGLLRQPVYEGLREDKSAADVVAEEPDPPVGEPPAERDAAPVDGVRVERGKTVAYVAGVRLTHPERELFGVPELTKLDLAHYYEAVAHRMLPHLAGRPLTLVRCPHGTAEGCFYQRHLSAREQRPPHVRGVRITGMTEPSGFIVLDSLEGVLELVQLGTLEFHTWGSRAEEPDRPDRLVFDLDPDESLPFSAVASAAQVMRTALQALGLNAFVKTTGGKGLHVVVPILPRETWFPAEEFARALVLRVVEAAPERFTANMRKTARAGGVFLDYVRNTKGSTSVAPYSTRAREGGPVSLPVAWEALDGLEDPRALVPRRVRDMIALDPWAGIGDAAQVVTAKMRRSVGLDG
jgi:bifunctional non-homologous end joining protein LigD